MTDVLPQSDIREAKERASRIRLGITSYLATLADIRSAWDRRDWQTLGYTDWDAYLDGEFSETRLRVPAEHRTKAINELRMAGMSTRAIASALNVSQATASRNVRQLSHLTQLDQPERVKGLDGRDRPATQPKPAKPALATVPEPTVHPESSSSPADREPETSPTTEPQQASPPPPQHPRRDAEPASAAPPAVRPPINEEDALRRSRQFGESLAYLFLALDPSPVRWFQSGWRGAAFPQRDLPRVRDAFTVAGLHALGDHLHALANHLHQNGDTL